MFAPNNNGAFVLHLGELDLSTEMVGDSQEIQLRIAGRALTALFSDNHLEAVQDSSGPSQPGAQDALYWKVCGLSLRLACSCSTLTKKLGYALIGEVSDLALAMKRSNIMPTQSEVRRVLIRSCVLPA